MELHIINDDNISLLKKFMDNTMPSTFRYFDKRTIDCIKNHLITLIGTINDVPMAYAHLDKEHNDIWFGICILDTYQKQGYGKCIMNYIIKYAVESSSNGENKITNIKLSVDNTNIIAKNLYLKYGFKEKIMNDKYVIMSLNISDLNPNNKKIIGLPVSFGEAIDKLTILDIKCGKLTDERKNDVLKEYNAIYEKIRDKIDTIKYFYEMLKRINLDIWNMQDDFRFGIKNKELLCKEIIKENDRRFLVKNKINNILSSDIREQKAYKKRKAFFLGHFGLGDCINMIGAVRYLSTIYDEVVVVCKDTYINNLKAMYENDATIKFYGVPSEKDISPKFGFSKKLFKQITNGFDVYLVGQFRDTHADINYLPYSFYDDINLPRTHFWQYSYFPETKKSRELFELTKNKSIPNKKYIFIHNYTSLGILFKPQKIFRQLKINATQYFIINPNSNYYGKEHPYYGLAQKFIGHLVMDYTMLIEQAEYNILSDSSFLCLAIQLDIKTNNNYYINRRDIIDRNHIWNGYEKFYKKKFKSLLNNKLAKFKILPNEKLRMLLDKYMITYKLDGGSYDYTGLGIGDILLSLYLLKSGKKNYIYINLNYFNGDKYYHNPINALEFRLNLINNICQYNKIDKKNIRYIFDFNGKNIVMARFSHLIKNVKNIKKFKLNINNNKSNPKFNQKLVKILDNKIYMISDAKYKFSKNDNHITLKKK